MDHATRHLSSPSPTSQFLFHHTEKSQYKSSPDPYAPLLSSETEDSDVNACFSVTANESAATENFSPNRSDEDSGAARNNHLQSTSEAQQDGNDLRHDDQDEEAPIILGHFSASETSGGHNSLTQSNGGDKLDADGDGDRDDDDEDDDDDDDENMRNVLSGSSRSSTTTMPLLTEAHNHSFSERISLEEYSPLSLVNDCDNALPMSPSSLACGSHHSSFKSSLNNLKMDHLGVDGVGDVGVHGVDDVVGDTRSMSPSLLSNPSSHNNHHNNLWSNSSTAITQNPSLLGSTSTSILLSQHSHHSNQHSNHQMSALMQQLEPQSLDEAPSLLGDNRSTTGLDSDLTMGQQAQLSIHRPSSEPPLNSGSSVVGDFELKTINNFSSTSPQSAVKTATQSNNRSRKQSSNISPVTLPSGSLSSKLGSPGGSASPNRLASTSKSRSARSRVRKGAANNVPSASAVVNPATIPKQHSSQLHLQLNHHKKLQELQQRLFGITPSSSNPTNNETKDAIGCVENTDGLKVELSTTTKEKNDTLGCGSGEEADSSAGRELTNPSIKSEKVDELIDNSKGTANRSPRQCTNKRKRPSRSQLANKNSQTNSSLCSDNVTTARVNQKVVKTETAEPDTTTKSSECLKLADLLAPNSNVEFSQASGNYGIVLDNGSFNRAGIVDCNNNTGDRKIQHIQLQMNPSLTVVANNNGLIQPINIQQHQLQLTSNEGAINANSNNNQSMRRFQPTITSLASTDSSSGLLAGAHIKCNIISNSDSNFNGDNSKSGNKDEPVNWPNNNQCNINSSDASGNNNTNAAQSSTATIAIQVICQDGTSLVLPVSSTTNLNTAVALSAQNQAQLQAILSNNSNNAIFSNCQQTPRSSISQVFPVVTMVNALGHNNVASNSGVSGPSQTVGALGSSSTSGLAASSPTLAALLDSGSNRSTTFSAGASDLQLGGQNFIASNLLRKIVGSSPLSQGQIITGDGSGSAGDTNRGLEMKRIKLELNGGEAVGNNGVRATTFTIIDPQGLIVTNGNETNCSNDSNNNNSSTRNCSEMTSGAETADKSNAIKQVSSSHQQANDESVVEQKQIISNNGTSTTSGVGGNGASGNRSAKVNNDGTMSKQITKMTSSTGNRQVDPAQPFRCEHCNSTFTRLGNFTRHKKIHTVPTKDGQRFKCDVCSKSFLQRCDLARHLHIHRGTEPHRCNICGKGYIRHSDLVTHQRFHNKEKPFGCPHCSKGFCQRGDLNRHLRSIHLQMKPILCPCCNRKFAKQETLLRHLNTAHRGNNKPMSSGSGGSQALATERPSTFQSTISNDSKSKDASGGANGLMTNNIENAVSGLDSDSDNISGSQSSSYNNQKSGQSNPVASLQAIQATLCKVQQSSEPMRKVRLVVAATDDATEADS